MKLSEVLCFVFVTAFSLDRAQTTTGFEFCLSNCN